VKVFITGGSGYIGQATIKILLRKGHEVSALARSEASAQALTALGAAIVNGGLSDLQILEQAAQEADAVIHLAQHRGPESGDIDRAASGALQAGAGSRPYIHTSGLWIYGNTDGVIDEDAPFAPPPVVAWRLENEARVFAHAQQGGYPVIVMPGVVYGDSQGLIENLMLAPARVDGSVAYIGDGAQHWPLVHVLDIAELYVCALEAPAGTRWAGVTTSAYTMREVAEAVSHAAGIPGKTRSVTLEEAREKIGGVADAFAQDQQISGERARRQLGWEPAYLRPLEELKLDGRSQAGSDKDRPRAMP
jgi:nucleoside-diphosphate-sugar epimerase